MKKVDGKQKIKERNLFSNFETNFVLNDYQQSIVKLMKKRDIEITPKDFLDKHSISKTLRAKMVD